VQDQGRCRGELAGSWLTSCPSTGLVGCCQWSTYDDYQCFYSGTQSSNASACGGATWMTTLP
jgi:hypothetical protein